MHSTSIFSSFPRTLVGTCFSGPTCSFNIYGRLAKTELLPTDKFTIVVNNEKSYALFFRRPPLSLRANLFVMLLDLDNCEVVKDEMLSKYE